MENNTSNYAKWIPEAGGYVNNGVVVSKTPVYNEAGGLIDLDMSTLSTPGTQENQANSGTDINAGTTQAGSLGTLNLNTAKPELGPINFPALQSNVAGETVLSPLDQASKDYEYMVGTGNLKGQIDALTKIGNLTGVDYSNTIKDLWNQRSQKIQNEDNAYTKAIAQANQAGDTGLAQELMMKQQLYRNSVDYEGQREMDLQNKQDELLIDFDNAYLTGINDIINGVTSQLLTQVNNLMNFQYNPQTDLNLQVAQGYAVGAVKEQMNHTGMYYSSMTQSAIARAVAELVPVYEKMARDEIKENISMLQNVGSYLMNLEQTQLSIWETQLSMKIKVNAEKRAQVNQAIESANARGYYTSEEAILLGVEPGTLSYEARKRAEDKQDEIEKEQRTLQNQMTLAKYNSDLQMQRTRQEYALKNQYAGDTEQTVEVTNEILNDDSSTTKIKAQIPLSRAIELGLISGNGTATAGTNAVSENVKNAISEISSLGEAKSYMSTDKFKDLSAVEKSDYVSQVATEYYMKEIDNLSNEFGDDYSKTKNAVNTAKGNIESFANAMLDSGVNAGIVMNTVDTLYKELFYKIDKSANFDYISGDPIMANESKKDAENARSKIFAKKDIVESMEKSNNRVLTELSQNDASKKGTDRENEYNEQLYDYQGAKRSGNELYESVYGTSNKAKSSINEALKMTGAITNPVYGAQYATEKIANGSKVLGDNIANFFNNLFADKQKNTISKADEVINQSTEKTNSTGEKSSEKIYVTISVPDSSGYTLEDFAKRLGFEYDSKKGKAYYYKGAYPEFSKTYDKYVKYEKSGGA